MTNFSENLRKKIETMSQEEIDALADKIQSMTKDIDSPSAAEYLTFLERKLNETRKE